jgi:hypothetical protein
LGDNYEQIATTQNQKPVFCLLIAETVHQNPNKRLHTTWPHKNPQEKPCKNQGYSVWLHPSSTVGEKEATSSSNNGYYLEFLTPPFRLLAWSWYDGSKHLRIQALHYFQVASILAPTYVLPPTDAQKVLLFSYQIFTG